MTQIDTENTCLTVRTMADLIDRIQADLDLSVARRRDLCSAVRCFVEHLRQDLRMSADFPTLRDRARRFTPAATGISAKRWSNIRSDVRFALTRYGARQAGRRPADLLPGWRVLQAQTVDRAIRLGLSRFAHWCSRQGIPPARVDDAVATRFHAYLAEETLVKRPRQIHQRTCLLWNRAVDRIPAWPRVRLTVPCYRNTVSLPLAAFPEPFRRDLARYAAIAGGQDVLAATAPETPLRPATVQHHLKLLRLFASALVHSGHPIERIGSVADLLAIDNFRAALQWRYDGLGGPRASLFELVAVLVAIARRHLGVPPAHLAELKAAKAKLRCRARGMTAKNRERLRPLLDRRNQARFLHLAERLVADASKRSRDKKAALLVQTALAHELLVVAPMRFGNLVRLDLARHVRYAGRGRTALVHIMIEGAEVKNGQPLQFELPPSAAALLELYRARYRPLLPAVGGDWLFPGQAAGHKHHVSLSGQLCAAVRRHTGLTVNPHLYRHIAAFFYLQAHPGEYETVRRLLGHRSIETTIQFYADFESYSAVRLYADTILAHRDGLRPPAGLAG